MLRANFEHVIHAVGPDWSLEPNPTDVTFEKGKRELQTTIENVFRAANGIGTKSIVLCVLSSGIFCHSGSQGKREKTAARQVLVESILTQVNHTGNSITKVVIFEYDNPADSLEANRRWEETKALLQEYFNRFFLRDQRQPERQRESVVARCRLMTSVVRDSLSATVTHLLYLAGWVKKKRAGGWRSGAA
jgi:hypothetical protein